jgi:hypothetical protein
MTDLYAVNVQDLMYLKKMVEGIVSFTQGIESQAGLSIFLYIKA